ncbi:MAG: response regulator transcription factor [Chitinophagales bacterium]|nr:response regulator transcription factor [Bacteroidota bacterium]
MEINTEEKEIIESNSIDARRYTIYIIDKDKVNLEKSIKCFKSENFIFKEFTKTKNLLDKIKDEKPDLILLEVNLNETDGIDMCWEIRSDSTNGNVPIIFLSNNSDDFTQLAAYEAGADDFIDKSTRPRLIATKIKAFLNRCYAKNDSKKEVRIFGNLEIDEEQVVVFKKGEPLKLSKKEFELVVLLSSKPKKVFKRNYILLKVWGDNIIVGDRNIDTHIKKIRKKLGKSHIETVRGIGYKFIP